MKPRPKHPEVNKRRPNAAARLKNAKEEAMTNTHTHTHEVLPGSKRTVLAGAKVLGPANAHTKMEVTLKLRQMKALPELKGRPTKPMTREDLAAFGASKEDIDKVTSALGKYGLTVVHSNPLTRSIRMSGTVASMENAFQVKLFNYVHENGNYRGRVGNIQIPSELKDIVLGVFGLDNRRVARRRRQPIRDKAHARAVKSVPTSWYTPAKLAAHYNFPAGQGEGQTIGILEFGGGFFEQDLATFCKMTGTAEPTVKPVSTDGTSTSAKDGAEGEVMLDVEIAAGCCPKSTIVLYFADFSEQGWITALDAVIQDKTNDPGVVSVSWGYAEDADIWTTQAMTQVNESMQSAALLGITVCIAAGDDGSSDAITDGHAHVDFPSSSPYVLSVGGTTIVSSGGEGDIVWKEGDGLRADNGGSTGGGVSAVFPRPDYQASVKIASVNPGAITGRVIPDVAANADWIASPYLLVVDGKSQPNGGTSAATPLVASLITLINEQRGAAANRIGYITPVLYQSQAGTTVGSQGCTDVESGNNTTDSIGGYTAGPGYDAVSGWGTPNGQKLMAALPPATTGAAHQKHSAEQTQKSVAAQV
jgi:kumamolisin